MAALAAVSIAVAWRELLVDMVDAWVLVTLLATALPAVRATSDEVPMFGRLSTDF